MNSRTTTPVVLTEIEYHGMVGYGEASMPPYLGESHDTATAFLSKVDLGQFANPFELESILGAIDGLAPGNPAAKASVDIALHDLVGKLMKQPWFNIWGYDPAGAGDDVHDRHRHAGRREAEDARGCRIQGAEDQAGQGHRQDHGRGHPVGDRHAAQRRRQPGLDRPSAGAGHDGLAEGARVPLRRTAPAQGADRRSRLDHGAQPAPIIGDEGVQRLPDVRKALGVYTGINIKLMKSTGMREAQKMLQLARGLGLKVMLGCMTETSCGISAASHLSPMVDWADLDGALLISNDAFDGAKVIDGKVVIPDRPGIGAVKLGARG